jgi:hypothetical protein
LSFIKELTTIELQLYFRHVFFHSSDKDIQGVKLKVKVKVKVKLSLCLTKHHPMNMYWGGGIAPLILDFGARRR